MFIRTAHLPSRISDGWREDFLIFYVSVALKKNPTCQRRSEKEELYFA